ncbi:hypothetical protein L345_13823, partial [Ophiophagus hannah]
MLMIGILAIHDRKNAGALPGTNAFITGLLVVLIGMSMGMNTGYAINPSRDFPPRIFTALAGWGLEVFHPQGREYRRPFGEDWEKKDGGPSAPMGAALGNGHLAQRGHICPPRPADQKK